MLEERLNRLLREQAFRFLENRSTELIDFAWASTFEFEGERVPLMDRQRGIRKPAIMTAALSMRTVFTPPGGRPPYADATGTDGLLRYKYRGDDPQHAENRALRRAYLDGLPLIWFVGVEPGRYEPIFPVWIFQDEPEQLQFVLALDEGQRRLSVGESVDDAERRYAERVNKQRLHQPLFRARVLAAYDEQCAMCRLRHAELLDAAHILADAHPSGAPVVPNGLSLCKIHHAAFDRNIIGIRPDLKVHVRDDILREIDGPMLRHGIQEMHDATLTVPRLRSARPNEAWLDERYSTFLRTPAPQGAGHH